MTSYRILKIPKVFILEGHPETCPVVLDSKRNKAIICGRELEETFRSGLKAEEGRFKNFCYEHGFVYHNLLVEKHKPITKEINDLPGSDQ